MHETIARNPTMICRCGRIPLLAAAVGFASVLACGLALGNPAMNGPAPALVAIQLDGRVFDLSKFRGRVVLVNYWATWCAPCKKEMPILNEFYRKHHAEGLELIGISADRFEDFPKMRRMSHSIAYPTAPLTQLSANGFGAPEGFPLTYVIDKEGVVRDKFIEVRAALLDEVVLPLLASASDHTIEGAQPGLGDKK
jgi:cytochrome c biogenesis protein CcmG/thiol:disulfide interchange protein DsbE